MNLYDYTGRTEKSCKKITATIKKLRTELTDKNKVAMKEYKDDKNTLREVKAMYKQDTIDIINNMITDVCNDNRVSRDYVVTVIGNEKLSLNDFR